MREAGARFEAVLPCSSSDDQEDVEAGTTQMSRNEEIKEGEGSRATIK